MSELMRHPWLTMNNRFPLKPYRELREGESQEMHNGVMGGLTFAEANPKPDFLTGLANVSRHERVFQEGDIIMRQGDQGECGRRGLGQREVGHLRAHLLTYTPHRCSARRRHLPVVRGQRHRGHPGQVGHHAAPHQQRAGGAGAAGRAGRQARRQAGRGRGRDDGGQRHHVAHCGRGEPPAPRQPHARQPEGGRVRALAAGQCGCGGAAGRLGTVTSCVCVGVWREGGGGAGGWEGDGREAQAESAISACVSALRSFWNTVKDVELRHGDM